MNFFGALFGISPTSRMFFFGQDQGLAGNPMDWEAYDEDWEQLAYQDGWEDGALKRLQTVHGLSLTDAHEAMWAIKYEDARFSDWEVVK